jgi:Zn-dependent M28 family amino/carboxypeptidase
MGSLFCCHLFLPFPVRRFSHNRTLMNCRWLKVFLLLVGIPVAAQQSFQFSPVPEERVWDRLAEVSGKNPEREQRLKALFTEAGCTQDHLAEVKVSGSKLPDLACTMPGETDRVIVVGAHFDKVDRGEGIADNWSGAAMLPSLPEVISYGPRRHTYVFLGFTDEEKGLVGSEYYVRHMNKEQQQKVSAMVNLDTVGLAPAEVWASHADKNLLRAPAIVAASMKLPISGMNVDGVGSSDSESFREDKMPSLTIHSVTAKNLAILHSPKDTLAVMQRKDYEDTFRLMCGYLAYLDGYLDQPPPPATSTSK